MPTTLITPFALQEVWDKDVAASIPQSSADWILPGLIARGNMTLMHHPRRRDSADGTAAGQALVEGAGRKTDPFRYWVQSAETRWRQNPLYDYFEQTQAEARKLRES